MTIPPEADKALAMVKEQFGESVVAVYLHGSAVTSGLRPDSDVDLLVVIDHPMTTAASARLVIELMKISGHPGSGSSARPIELIVALLAELTALAYPARCEFMYGEWLRSEFETGEVPKPASDPEFTLVLAQARQEAKPLVGPDARALLPVIPRSDIRRAIEDALPALVATLEGDERNVLLTLARMWRTATTDDFVSKDVAAEWAIARLPAEPAAVLADAREGYLGLRDDDWSARQSVVQQTTGLLHQLVVASL